MRAWLILGLVVFACVATPARAEEPTLGMRYLQMGWGWEAPTWKEAAVLGDPSNAFHRV